MDPNELKEVEKYLHDVLMRETLVPGGPELRELEQVRNEVEDLLREEFGEEPDIREGGSKAKKTMVRSSYDLDLPVYFPRDSESAGSTIKEIFESVERVLQRRYLTERKGPAIRVLDAGTRRYLRVDVVPGRYVDGEDGDVFVYPSSTDKERLKTNLGTHIEHIRESGVREAIRLLKVWRNLRGIGVKTFALELLVVKLLKGQVGKPLTEQVIRVWVELVEKTDELTIEDPANPEGNDLSGLLNDSVRKDLAQSAARSLDIVNKKRLSGWKEIFGPVEGEEEQSQALRRTATAISISRPNKPWCQGNGA